MGDLDDPDSGIRKFLSITPVQTRTPGAEDRAQRLLRGRERGGPEPAGRPRRRHLHLGPARPAAPREPGRLRRSTPRPTPAPRSTPRTRVRGAGGCGPTSGRRRSRPVRCSRPRSSLLLVEGPNALNGVVAPVLGALFAVGHRRPARSGTSSDPTASTTCSPNPTGRRGSPSVRSCCSAFGAVISVWFLGYVFGADGLVEAMAWFGVPAAVMTAGYTAFLFGQAEGRDLWQSPVLFWHLQAQALMVGAGAMLVVAPFVDASETTVVATAATFVVGTAAAPADAARRVRRQALHPQRRGRGAHHHARSVREDVLVRGHPAVAGGPGGWPRGRTRCVGLARRRRRSARAGRPSSRTSPCSSKPRKTSRCPEEP